MFTKWFVVAVVVSGFLLGAGTASGQPRHVDPANLAMAQELFDAGVRLMGDQKLVEACAKFEQVTALVPSGVGGHGKLAECYEKVGRLGSAWEHYATAQALAYASAQGARAQQMSDRAKALESRVARLTLVVPKGFGGVDGLTITLDGKLQEKALWNTPQPVDAGEHVVEVKAPARETRKETVTILADGAKVDVDVVLGPIPPPPPPPPARVWQRPLGWTTVAVGSASLITSGILSGLAVGKANASNADGHCRKVYEPAERIECNDVGLPLRNAATNLANGATATVVFGGILAAGGIVLVATAPKQDERKTGIRWSVEVAPMGVGLRGTW